jgi:hypothetical protein
MIRARRPAMRHALIAVVSLVAVLAAGAVHLSSAGDRKIPEIIPPDRSMKQILTAVVESFPGAYPDLAHVTYEHVEGRFSIDSVRFLVPEKRIRGVPKDKLKERACKAKKMLGLDCACEDVTLEPAKDYAWHAWPDKRVVPVTVQFLIAC